MSINRSLSPLRSYWLHIGLFLGVSLGFVISGCTPFVHKIIVSEHDVNCPRPDKERWSFCATILCIRWGTACQFSRTMATSGVV